MSTHLLQYIIVEVKAWINNDIIYKTMAVITYAMDLLPDT